MHKKICRNAKPQWSITWFHSAKSGIYARLSVKQGMIGHKRRILRWELKGKGDASGLVDRKLGQRRGYDMLQFSGQVGGLGGTPEWKSDILHKEVNS